MPHFALGTLALASLCVAQSTVTPAPLGAAPVTHASLFLRPAAFHAAPGAMGLKLESIKPVEQGAPQGQALQFQDAPWPESIRWLYSRSPGYAENHDDSDAPRAIAGARSVSLTLEHSGVTVVGLDLPARVVEWPAGQLRAIQVANAANTVLPESGDVRVRLVESAKTILSVGAAGEEPNSAGAGKMGQAVEIRPCMDPTVTPVGADILFRVYVNGDSVKNASLTATNAGTGQTQQVRLSPTGAGFFHVAAAGVWHLEFGQVRRIADNADTPWVVYAATLTFSTPGDGAPPAAPPPPPPRNEAPAAEAPGVSR